MKTIREIATSHQQQMGSVDPYTIIDTIAEAIMEYAAQSPVPEWWDDERYLDLKNAHCDLICDLLLKGGTGTFAGEKMRRVAELVAKGLAYEGLED